MSMDESDRKILTIVQRNNRLTHEQISDQINISPSAVRRRLTRLRQEGVIVADVALLKPGKHSITAITSVRLVNETHKIYESFKKKMKGAVEVAQCYTVSGETDFIIVAHFSDLPSYEKWIDRYILSDDSVQRSDTNIVYSCVKYETAINV